MPKFAVRKQFTSWEEVIVIAPDKDSAVDIAEDTWYDLNSEGVGDYDETGIMEVEEV